MGLQDKYDRKDIRRLNAVNVLNQLRINRELSRANIAAKLGLTRATVSNIVSELIAAGLLLEAEYLEGQSGRPGLLLQLNPNFGAMIALEIDVDRVVIMLTNFKQVRLWRQSVAMPKGASVDTGLGLAEGLLSRALKIAKDKALRCLGIGVAWAGLVNRNSGELAYGPTSRWENVPLRQVWEDKYGLPVYVENEAHAAAIGMYHFNNDAEKNDIVYLSLGVGLGAGVIIDGNLLRGRQGYAGQVGHVSHSPNGHPCSCGKTGCWITEVGAVAILRELSNANVSVNHDASDEVAWIDQVCEMAEAGDEAVLSTLANIGQHLGEGIARLVETFNPSSVIVGGRLGKVIKYASPSIAEVLKNRPMHAMGESVELTVSCSEEDSLVGCLASVFDAAMKNPVFDSVS
ncbi:ROK family transcriptional regulator [Puniceicoccaceae bacterium K14]|nr:ROK family transcriptional regulator [Puniceicoccaceae bacterium K14]